MAAVVRPVEFHAAHAIEQFFEQLALAGIDVGDKADQHDLESDDHQDGRQDERLEMAAVVAAAENHGYLPLVAQGQEAVERVLFEQRIAAGEQQAVV